MSLAHQNAVENQNISDIHSFPPFINFNIRHILIDKKKLLSLIVSFLLAQLHNSTTGSLLLALLRTQVAPTQLRNILYAEFSFYFLYFTKYLS